jgi:hypothetical protein
MEILNSFLGQGMVTQIGEIVLFANTVTMAMPTRWRENMMMDYISKILNNHIGWHPPLVSFRFLVGC